MEVFPSDLDTDRYLMLLRRRLSPITWASNQRAANYSTPTTPSKRAKRLLKLWMSGTDIPADRAERAGQVLWNSAPVVSSRFAWVLLSVYFGIFAMILNNGTGEAVAPFLAAWAAVSAALLLSPKLNFRKAHRRAIDSTEIDAISAVRRGRLDEAYINLVQDVMRAEITSPAAQSQIRQALQALGNAVAVLPAERPQNINARDLVEKARELRAQAAREPDLLVRESLIRHAAALEERSLTADDSARIARRVQALRREVREQMDSLRSLLLLNDSGAAIEREAAVQRLTDAVHVVSRDAHAHALAHRELLDEDLSALLGSKSLLTPTAQPAQAPQQQVVRQQGAAAPTTPQPTLGSRHWWRNGG